MRDAERAEKAGQDFESLLLGHWLEEAQESLGSAPGGGEDDEEDSTRTQFQAIGMQSLATAITKAGGIGLAKMIGHQLRHLDKEGPASQPPEISGSAVNHEPKKNEKVTNVFGKTADKKMA